MIQADGWLEALAASSLPPAKFGCRVSVVVASLFWAGLASDKLGWDLARYI